MNLKLRTIFGVFITLLIICLLFSGSTSKALATTPAEPIEKDFYLGFFPLFRFIKPTYLKVYENQDRPRKYPLLYVCNDQRAKKCFEDTDCVGPVDLCNVGSATVAQSDVMGNRNGRCQKNPPPPTRPGEPAIDPSMIQGNCKYNQSASSSDVISSTDFSNPVAPSASFFTSLINSILGIRPPTNSNILVNPKAQNKADHYDYQTKSGNVIGNGLLTLTLPLCEQLVRKAIVVKQAEFTHSTVLYSPSHEWPLGWVDWNDDSSGVTLLQLSAEWPGNVAAAAYNLTLAHENFLYTVGNNLGKNTPDTFYGEDTDQKTICDAVTKALKDDPVAPENMWAVHLSKAPMYPPSNTRGYARKSVCKWHNCCPGLECPLKNPAKSFALYTDPSVHQAFAAAIDELFITHPLEGENGALKIYDDLVIKNPLVKYALLTQPNAVPSAITAKLDAELGDKVVQCRDADNNQVTFNYVTGNDNPLTLGKLGFTYDYQEKMDGKCYKLQPADLTKEPAGAYADNVSQDLVASLFPTDLHNKIDMVDLIRYHYITIPDAMGQSLDDLQQAAYNIRDPQTVVAQADQDIAHLSNTVNSTGGIYPYAGNSYASGFSKRFLSLYSCTSVDDYSQSNPTSIKDYALAGVRIGCAQPPVGACDGTKFTEITKDSQWQAPLPVATNDILNSKMFVNGRLNPELEKVYAEAEKETGVPCEVIAGIHFEEASAYFTDNLGDPANQSVQNGGDASRDGGLQTSAINAAKTLQKFSNTKELIVALMNFNGPGNNNCQPKPLNTPYTGCPPAFYGDDNPYSNNLLDSKHNFMYLIYHVDLTASAPTPYGLDRPGAFAAALAIHNAIMGGSNSQAP